MTKGTGIFDLRITDKWTGESFFYVMDTSQPMKFGHSVKKPQKPFDEGVATLGVESYAHDVRFTEGRKSISFLDWSEGSGQQLYDVRKASQSRFLESRYADIGTAGRLSMLKEAVEYPLLNAGGPILSALGELWLGTMDGGLVHGTDGVVWDDCTFDVDTRSSISDITTDGEHIYFCRGFGDETGIWWNPDGDYAFERYYKTDDNATTIPITNIRWAAGTLLATTANTAGYVELDGSYEVTSPDYVNTEGLSVALIATESFAYWLTSKRGVSKVYKLYYSPDADTVITEQFQEFPNGFVATCGTSYSGNLDIGGYWMSKYDGVGKGSVYRASSGYMQLLFDLGAHPEDTDEPEFILNDNRIIACTSGSKDVYWLTNRECYRWDLDDGGVSHVFDYKGAAMEVQLSSEYQFADMPTGGTRTTDGRYTVHTFTEDGDLVVPVHYNKHGIPIDTIQGEYLLVGGGGAGGSTIGGGGGGGGVEHGSVSLTGTMPVVIGAGATVGDDAGGTSTFAGYTAAGGGSGGDGGEGGEDGASGGGAGGGEEVSGGGIGSRGGDGGDSATNELPSTRTPAGGGGGATESGGDATEEEL